MKIYTVLKDFVQGFKKFEQGVEVALSDAAAKYHLLSGRVKAVESNVIVTAETIVADVKSVAAKVSNAISAAEKLEAKVSKSVVANVAVANTANVSTTTDGPVA